MHYKTDLYCKRYTRIWGGLGVGILHKITGFWMNNCGAVDQSTSQVETPNWDKHKSGRENYRPSSRKMAGDTDSRRRNPLLFHRTQHHIFCI